MAILNNSQGTAHRLDISQRDLTTQDDLDIRPLESDPLREAFRIGRGQTIMLARKPHLEALLQNREEILVTLKQALSLLDAFVHEVEVATGRMGATRDVVADIQKRYDVEVSA